MWGEGHGHDEGGRDEAEEADLVFVGPSEELVERLQRVKEEFAAVTDEMTKLERETVAMDPDSEQVETARARYRWLKNRREELGVLMQDLKTGDLS